jgi:hypothetical protein
LISESDDGVSVNTTRQNEGKSTTAADGALASGAAEGANRPEVTDCANVTLAFWRWSDAANRSHVAASIDARCAWSSAAHDRAHARDVNSLIL